MEINERDGSVQIRLDSGLMISLPNKKNVGLANVKAAVKVAVDELDHIARSLTDLGKKLEPNNGDARTDRDYILGFAGRIQKVADSLRY